MYYLQTGGLPGSGSRQINGDRILEGFPILITIVIIKRLKVDSIVEVRQKYWQEQKDHELQELEKLKQGQYNLQEEFEQMAAQKSTLK